jgi:hypothetical protein
MTNDVLEGCPGCPFSSNFKELLGFSSFDWQGERNRENPRGSQDKSSLHLLCKGLAALSKLTTVPEFIDPVFTKTSPKRSFSLNRKRAFLVFVKTGSIISGTGLL